MAEANIWTQGVLSLQTNVVPPLSEFRQGVMEVDDVDGFVTSMLGCDFESSGIGVNWDTDSGIGRARVYQDYEPVWMPKKVDVIQVV